MIKYILLFLILAGCVDASDDAGDTTGLCDSIDECSPELACGEHSFDTSSPTCLRISVDLTECLEVNGCDALECDCHYLNYQIYCTPPDTDSGPQ